MFPSAPTIDNGSENRYCKPCSVINPVGGHTWEKALFRHQARSPISSVSRRGDDFNAIAIDDELLQEIGFAMIQNDLEQAVGRVMLVTMTAEVISSQTSRCPQCKQQANLIGHKQHRRYLLRCWRCLYAPGHIRRYFCI